MNSSSTASSHRPGITDILPGFLKTALAVVAALLIASSWLVFPYYFQGDALLSNAGDNARQLKGSEVSRYFSRTLLNHAEFELTATFATEEFFQYVDDATVIRNLRPDQNYIFYVNEMVHTGSLPESLPTARLLLGDESINAVASTGPSRADHHRVTVYSFARTRPNGASINLADYDNIRLAVSNPWLGSERHRTYLGMWETPYVLPDEVRDSSGISMIAILALGAGLLSSVLTPCLLQMMVIFGGMTAGFATVPGNNNAPAKLGIIRRKLLFTATAFVIGFIALYVAAGALIGALGFSAQLFFAEYRTQVSLAAGILVLVLGFWVLLRGNHAVVCRIPPEKLISVTTWRDAIASSLTAIGTALGCTVCFGGAIVGTLIIYVGIIGDVLIGAGIMFVFALGFALPLMLAAWCMSRSDGLIGFINTHSRSINTVSAFIIMGFGIILMTDNFHVVSDYIYPYLRLN